MFSSLFATILYCIFYINIANSQSVLTKRFKINDGFRRNDEAKDLLCDEDEFFDTARIKCRKCPDNLVPRTDKLDSIGNPYACECPTGFFEETIDCSEDATGECVSVTCTSCLEGGEAAFKDFSACVPCDGTATLNTDTGDCECNVAGEVLLERDVVGEKLSAKTCQACPIGTAVVTTSGLIAGRYYEADPYTCQSCPDPLMSMSESSGTYSCSCPNGYTIVGVSGIGEQSCLLTTLADSFLDRVDRAKRVEYYGAAAGRVDSLTMEHYFLNAAARCTYWGRPEDTLYCQQLANLCALQLFNDQTEACAVHLEMIDSRGKNRIQDISNWVFGSPWLYYDGLGNDACTTAIYNSRVTFQQFETPYVLASYFMNGTLRAIEPLGTTLSYCTASAPDSGDGGGSGSDTRWQYFGSSIQTNFTCDIQNLIDTQEQYFYEMLIWHTNKDWYSPVPVRIVNMRSTIFDSVPEKKPNKLVPSLPLCDINDVLVRRFFLFDKLSGITKLPSNPFVAPNPKVIRYAKYITVEASLIENSAASIYPPVITIEYKEVETSNFKGEATNVDVEFNAFYTMNLTGFFTNFEALFIVIMVFTGLWFALRFYNWKIRNSRMMTEQKLSTDLGAFNFGTLMEICILLMSTWNYVFFWVTVCVCWYFFAFFKMPIVPSQLLPPELNIYSLESPYYMFIVNMHVMAFFQLTLVLIMCYRQARADIFFIDWEPTRSKVEAGANSKASGSGSVSVWRTILVANEWSELQTVRKTDIRFTLIFLLFILIGLGADNNGTFQPDVDNKDDWQMSIVLRFGNTTFFWLLLSFAQYMWKFMIAERYLGEPPERLFIDFCTIAKVSVIVLDEKYHGYYLHCRSPHQYADGTMSELVQMLHKEEAGLTTDRSLEGAPPEVQSFRVYLTSEFREAFDKIKTNLVGADSMTEVIQQGRNRTLARAARGAAGRAGSGTNAAAEARARGFRNNVPSERVLKAWKEMMVFLQEFVENNFGKPGLRRTVREPTYWEKFANAGPDLSMNDQPSVFFTDREYQYTKTFFLGRETELLMLNILAYGLCNIWFDSPAWAAFFTYMLELGVVQFRHSLGENTIAKKTLIDERFLI